MAPKKPWWRVDFQEEIQVARVVITNRGNITYLNIMFISAGRVLVVKPRTTTDIVYNTGKNLNFH
jgi:hypothetical protein